MWTIALTVQSRTVFDTTAIAACLATDCNVVWTDEDSFTLMVEEALCKDARAMWNTRLRGLIATDTVLSSFSKFS